MFRSFFPEPKLFFSSAVVWLLAATLLFIVGGRSAPSSASTASWPRHLRAGRSSRPADIDRGSTPTAAGAAGPTRTPRHYRAPRRQRPLPATACRGHDFLNGDKIWVYQYILMLALLFCVFWYFYKRNEWYWWCVVGSVTILRGRLLQRADQRLAQRLVRHASSTCIQRR